MMTLRTHLHRKVAAKVDSWFQFNNHNNENKNKVLYIA